MFPRKQCLVSHHSGLKFKVKVKLAPHSSNTDRETTSPQGPSPPSLSCLSQELPGGLHRASWLLRFPHYSLFFPILISDIRRIKFCRSGKDEPSLCGTTHKQPQTRQQTAQGRYGESSGLLTVSDFIHLRNLFYLHPFAVYCWRRPSLWGPEGDLFPPRQGYLLRTFNGPRRTVSKDLLAPAAMLSVTPILSVTDD